MHIGVLERQPDGPGGGDERRDDRREGREGDCRVVDRGEPAVAAAAAETNTSWKDWVQRLPRLPLRRLLNLHSSARPPTHRKPGFRQPEASASPTPPLWLPSPTGSKRISTAPRFSSSAGSRYCKNVGHKQEGAAVAPASIRPPDLVTPPLTMPSRLERNSTVTCVRRSSPMVRWTNAPPQPLEPRPVSWEPCAATPPAGS
jgi:hypothetical protein